MSNYQLFEGGPLSRWERSLGLLKPQGLVLTKATLLAILVGWLPMAILAVAQLLFASDGLPKSFLSDFAVHARFLVAVPALILAEADCVPRLGRIVKHFAETDLIIGPDRDRFEAAISSTRRLLDSRIAQVVVIVFVYAGVVGLALYFSDGLPEWHRSASTSRAPFSLIGWWHALVSLPLLLIIFFGWLWRVILWTRLLFLISRLDLRLIPGHPDRVGGLRFVSSSLRGFRLISFACGAVVAGSILNRQVHQGAQPLDFKNLVIALLVFLIVLSAGPLTIFFKKLRQTKRRGVFEYGALARTVGTEFETKWLIRKKGAIDHASLEAQDFSATTDLYSVTNNVYAMRDWPFTFRNLIGPVVLAALLPFLPLVLLALPMEVILKGVVKLLF